MANEKEKSKKADKVLTYIRRGNLEFRPCVISDVDIIVDNMRLPDIRECALVGVTPKLALHVPFVEEGSRGFTICHNDKPIAMCVLHLWISTCILVKYGFLELMI